MIKSIFIKNDCGLLIISCQDINNEIIISIHNVVCLTLKSYFNSIWYIIFNVKNNININITPIVKIGKLIFKIYAVLYKFESHSKRNIRITLSVTKNIKNTPKAT